MSHHRTSAATVVALALTIGACADSPTTPQAAARDAAAPTTTAATATGAFGGVLQDASARLLPSLGEAKLRLELEHRLDLLAVALESKDKTRVRRELTLTRKVVAKRQRAGDVADLAALSLMLDQIEADFGGGAVAEQP